MGNVESEEQETLPELKKMKLILDKGTYKVFEDTINNQKYDFWFLKSSVYDFKEEQLIAEEIKKVNLPGISQIHRIQLYRHEKLFNNYNCLNILTEHPSYTLKEYLQKKAQNQQLTNQQITDLFATITNAQFILGSKKQYLGFDNIYTSDGKIWQIKPFIQTNSFYQELLQYKSKNLTQFEMSGFPSPEEFQQIKCDSDRVQIFGFGMLLLELIIKQKSQEIYQKYQIDETKLQQRITFLKAYEKKYPGKLIELVINTLDLDLTRRPNYCQLKNDLQSKESNIQSDYVVCQAEPLDKKLSLNLNSLLPPDSQNLENSIALQFSKIESKLNSKINDHRIKNSSKTKQSQQNVVPTQNFNYYGKQINGKYHGEGKIYTKTNLLVYDGEFFEGNYHKFGTLKYYDSIVLKENFNYQDCTNIEKYALCYEGSFQHGIKNGEGKLTLTNGEVYAGTFVNNVIDGYGAFQPNNHKKVIGIWIKGIFQSSPSIIQSFQNFNDNMEQDMRGIQQFDQDAQTNLSDENENNLQTFYYDDEKTQIKYVGQMNQGLKEGQGKLFFQDGKVQYVGDFSNDLFNGYGTLYNYNPIVEYQINYQQLGVVQTNGYWNHYQGTFQNGLKSGIGIWYLTNNSEFEGFFDNDLPHGQGTIRRIQQADLNGEWINGQLQEKQ